MTFTDGTILQTNNIDGQNNLKTAVGVNDHSSEQEKFLYNEIWQIIDSYLRIRSTESESDLIKNDKKLLLQFQEDFQKALSEYLNQTGKTLDIESMISDLIRENKQNEDLINEVKNLIKLSLQRMISDKINGKVTNSVKIGEISEQLNNIKIVELKDKQIEKIIYETFDGNNKYIKEAKQEFCTKQEKYKEDLIKNIEDSLKGEFDAVRERYRIGLIKSLNKNFMRDLQKVNYLNRQQETSPENKFRWKVDKTTVKYANIIVDSLILALNVGITKRIIDQTSKATKFLVSAPVKIVKSVSKFIKSLTKTIFSSVIGIVNNFILAPINFILTKSFNIIGGLTKTISKTLHFILEDMKVKYLTITPAGMYALGFLCGYIWTRLKSVIPELTFDIDGIMLLFTKLYSGVMSLFDIAKGWWYDFTIYHSGMVSTIKRVFKNTSEFFSVLFSKDGGLKDALNQTEYGQSIKRIYESIINSGWFSIVKVVFEGVVGLSKFILEHPILFGTLFSAASLVQSSKSLRNMLSRISTPLSGLKGGLIPILLGTSSAFATEVAMNGIFRMFGTDYSEKAVNFYDSQKQRYYDNREKFNGKYMQDHFSKLNDKNKRKYELVLQRLDEEYNNNDDYYMLLYKVQKIVESGDSGIERLTDHMPNLVQFILHGNQDIKNGQEYQDAHTKKDIKRQIVALMNILSTKQKKLSEIQERILSSDSEDQLDVAISRFVDNNGNVNLFRNIDKKNNEVIYEFYQKKLDDASLKDVNLYINELVNRKELDDYDKKEAIKEVIYEFYQKKLDSKAIEDIPRELKDIVNRTDIDKYDKMEIIKRLKNQFHSNYVSEDKKWYEIWKGDDKSSVIDERYWSEKLGLLGEENYNKLNESGNIKKLASFFDGKASYIHEKEISLMVQNATAEQRKDLLHMLNNVKDPAKMSDEDRKYMVEMRQKILGQYFEPYKKQILDSTTYLKEENSNNIKEITRIKKQNEQELNDREQNMILNNDQMIKRNEYAKQNEDIHPTDSGVTQ